MSRWSEDRETRREREREERNSAFGDAVYDAWRRGMDPDRVSRDRVYDNYDATGSREEAAQEEVRYLRQQDRARAERHAMRCEYCGVHECSGCGEDESEPQTEEPTPTLEITSDE